MVVEENTFECQGCDYTTTAVKDGMAHALASEHVLRMVLGDDATVTISSGYDDDEDYDDEDYDDV